MVYDVTISDGLKTQTKRVYADNSSQAIDNAIRLMGMNYRDAVVQTIREVNVCGVQNVVVAQPFYRPLYWSWGNRSNRLPNWPGSGLWHPRV